MCTPLGLKCGDDCQSVGNISIQSQLLEMAVFSKMAGHGGHGQSRRAAVLAAGMGVGAFVASHSFEQAFVGPRSAMSFRTVGGNSNAAQMQTTQTAAAPSMAPVAGVTGCVGGMGAAIGASVLRQRTRKSSRRTPVQAGPKDADHMNVFQSLVDLATNMVRDQATAGVHTVQKLQAFAAAEFQKRQAQGSQDGPALRTFANIADEASSMLHATGQAQLRWAASAAASMLLTFTVSLQPANALDEVTYSDFLDQVQKGTVEMVRVQNDMLTAQYTSKDGSRHEVNLVPNAMVEDALFNKLAESKVDVVMQNSAANNGGPMDFLARFAGPIAWLIAGLLFLFGGMGMGGPMGGPGGPGGNPFELGKSKARIIKDGDTKVKPAPRPDLSWRHWHDAAARSKLQGPLPRSVSLCSFPRSVNFSSLLGSQSVPPMKSSAQVRRRGRL